MYSTRSTSVKTAIDMSSFANGIYFLKVENEKNVTTIRIVRSK
ncbi:MAG: T9SS type A sorting domain-containing protein [Bacteroidetes bacterium]|nr:T9SS type A sorting domain-containing protein [Bacteroidota bacterium]